MAKVTLQKINLGCGFDHREGWINIDAVPAVHPDLMHDLHEPLPFADNSVVEVLAQDILEHFTKEKVTEVIAEIGRVVKLGGKVTLRVPSISAITEQLQSSPEARNQFLYGNTAETGIFGAHKVGFTPEFLTQLFLTQGFELVSWQLVQTNYQAEFVKKSKPKKLNSVAFLVTTFGRGGAEEFITNLALYLQAQGTQVTIWTNFRPWMTELERQSITTQQMPLALDVIGNWKGLLKSLLLLPVVVLTDGWVVWQTRASDVLVIAGFSQKLTFSWWARVFKRPLAWIEFGPLGSVAKKFFYLPKVWYYLAKWQPSVIIVPSKHTFMKLITEMKVDLAKLRKIVCAVPPPAKKRATVQPPNLVVCVSRLEPGKGQDRLIVAFARVVKSIPDAKLRIVGEGQYETTLNQLIKKHRLQQSVTLVGRTESAIEEMRQGDVCVFPSTWSLEGFGLTVIEAMSLAKPVLMFDRPPQNELVTDEITGTLIPEQDDAKETKLANALIQLLKDKRGRAAMGRRAFAEYQTKYTFEQVGPAYEAVFIETKARMQAQKQLARAGWQKYDE